MIELELFNVVPAKASEGDLHVDFKEGVIVTPNALWAKSQIKSHLKAKTLSGEQLNATFHKSWEKIKNSSRAELAMHQIVHYLSTYGTQFTGEVYIPDEVLEIPEKTISFKVVRGASVEEINEKCLGILRSGIALKQETLAAVLKLLSDNGYPFTGEEGIRNKEAVVMLADQYKVMPQDPVEFLRFVVYKMTGETLLIKSDELIERVRTSGERVAAILNDYPSEKLAEIFNRFKPIFLAMKNRKTKAVINKISKLSKKHHKPLVQNPLNAVTNKLLALDDMHWLENATVYALFKALVACHNYGRDKSAFVYRIRNGKSWVKEGSCKPEVAMSNYAFILRFLQDKFGVDGDKVFIPKHVVYALPTSEKMFVGNIPTGTQFVAPKIAAGVYWENKWGANDIDVSGLNIQGKIGWNAAYNMGDQLLYSGDMTNARNGAVEYLHAVTGEVQTTLVMSNVYSGEATCDYKIVVGAGDKLSRNYMMNPDKVMAEAKTTSVQKQTVLGMITPYKDMTSFVLMNFGAGSARVSDNSAHSAVATRALYHDYSGTLNLNVVLQHLGYNVVSEAAEGVVSLSPDVVTKSTFVDLFKRK